MVFTDGLFSPTPKRHSTFYVFRFLGLWGHFSYMAFLFLTVLMLSVGGAYGEEWQAYIINT